MNLAGGQCKPGLNMQVSKFLYIYRLISPKLTTMLEATAKLTVSDYLIIAAYFSVILVVGALTGRKQDKEEFLISGRKLTSLQATTTIFSSRI